MKKLLTKENVYVAILTLIAIHPFIELDYLIYDSLNTFGIPRFTTIVDFVLYPLLVLLVFWFFDKNKKKTIILLVIYAILFGIFFVLHCKNCEQLMADNTMLLPDVYVFTIKEEFFYCATLILPLVYIYVFNLEKIKESLVEKMCILISYLVSFPILISNLFLFGKSTYEGMTIANIFSWFSLPFDEFDHRPRLYATKFFFKEGNSIGILLIFTLPLLYYFYYKAKGNKKKKIFIGTTIFIQSLGMIILSTRVACYGACIIPFVMMIIHVLLCLLKKDKIQKAFIAFLAGMLIVTGAIMPVCPAVQNQLIDAQNYEVIKQHDDYMNQERDKIKRDAYSKWTEEWRNYYSYMFEEYAFLINVTPPIYYNELYSYKWDPQFWVDLIFDYTLEERINGRQIEQIFTDYKYETLDTVDKALGMGYSEYMWGGILIERDFIQQFYTMGYIGFALICGPWIVLALYAGIKLILNNKKWNYYNITLMMIVCISFVASYVSGHTIDQLSCSMVMALVLGILLHNLGKKDEEA